MTDRVFILDPYGILKEFNPNFAKMTDANPDIEGNLARITDRTEKGTYLEPFFFHPDQGVQARAAIASVELTQSKFSDYLTNVLATATEPTTLKAAATTVWQSDRISGVVDSIRAYLHVIDRVKVRKIVTTLLEHAPDAASRTRLNADASSRGVNLLNM